MEFIKIILEIILNIILFLMIFQISTIIHEFGHALLALILTKKNVKITLGRNNEKLKRISLRRLDIELKGFNPFTGSAHWNESKLTKFQRIMILAGGPIVSLVLGIVLLLISRNMQDKLLIEIILLKEMIILAGNYQLVTFISTSIPIIYPKWWVGYGDYPSDGYQIIKLMKANKIN
ncbi:MAG: hypothetical protein GX962_07805 [Epulopiscium sp.]|nr:hypothetical protein [Candidatus Epulonipiscium sp.]